jgi:hypothetical protein
MQFTKTVKTKIKVWEKKHLKHHKTLNPDWIYIYSFFNSSIPTATLLNLVWLMKETNSCNLPNQKKDQGMKQKDLKHHIKPFFTYIHDFF